MSVMVCPKCGGCGEITLGNNNTSVGFYKSTCPSCGGTGYISDASPTPPNVTVNIDNLKLERAMSDHYLKCPKCGEAIRLQLGHYLVLPDSAKIL